MRDDPALFAQKGKQWRPGLGANMTFFLILMAALGKPASAAPDIPDPSLQAASTSISTGAAFTEPQYLELVRCTLARNRTAVEAWIDARFKVSRGHDAAYRRVTGHKVTLPDVFAGCHQLQNGPFPFNLDRLARDWADEFGITEDDPGTLQKQMERSGLVTVTSFDGYVACIRQKNPPEAIQAYLTADGAAKAHAILAMTRDCAVAPGARLKMDLAEIDRELGKP